MQAVAAALAPRRALQRDDVVARSPLGRGRAGLEAGDERDAEADEADGPAAAAALPGAARVRPARPVPAPLLLPAPARRPARGGNGPHREAGRGARTGQVTDTRPLPTGIGTLEGRMKGGLASVSGAKVETDRQDRREIAVFR